METHLTIDIGPGLLSFLTTLPVLIAAIVSAIYSIRSHQLAARTNGNVEAALGMAAKDRAAAGLPAAPTHTPQ